MCIIAKVSHPILRRRRREACERLLPSLHHLVIVEEGVDRLEALSGGGAGDRVGAEHPTHHVFTRVAHLGRRRRKGVGVQGELRCVTV
jgi:hypothetical protein